MMGNYPVRFGGRERRVLIEARPSRPNAELGAAFVSGAIGIKLHDREDHAAYLSNWLGLCSPRHKPSNREVAIM